MTRLSGLTVSELAEGICVRAGRIAAAQAELLVWIAEFDRREGWMGHGLLSCAHWLSWRIGLSPSAAREQVRVARRLEDLPALAAAFADGRVSYSKVRAITRAAGPDDGIDWVGLARHSSGAQLEKIVRGIRRARANEAARLDPEAAAWSLRTRVRYDDNGNFILTISGPAQHLPVLQAGIDAKRAELQRHRDATGDAGDNPAPSPPAPAPAEPAVAVPAQPAGASAEAPLALPAPATSSVEAAPDLDQQAAGWPQGTSWRDVRAAAAALHVTNQRLVEQAQADQPTPPTAATDPAADSRASAEAPTPVSAPAPAPASNRVTEAEALLALAQDALAAEHTAHPDIARRRRPRLTAQLDPLSGWARQIDGELLPPSSLHTIMKTLPGRDGILRLRPITTADLHRHDLGRTQREANTALRELLGILDGERCRFPGCTRHKNLHAHHVVYWADGGRTDLDNLVLVCSRHHTLIHTQGFTLTLHPDRRLDVHTPHGDPILHHPAQPWGDPAALTKGRGRLVSVNTLPPDNCTDRIDLGYVVNVLLAQAA
jgi:hypothetical protein